MEVQWSLVLFTVLSGMGAWLFAWVGIDEFKGLTKRIAFPASMVAFGLIVIGGICSMTHLSHPERAIAALGHPAPGIFLEALLLGILAIAIIVYVILMKRAASASARKVIAVIGIVIAIVFTFACGSSYMMSSRPAWDTIALPLGYVGTAAVSGTALYLLLCVALKEDTDVIKFAGVGTAASGALALILVIAYGLVSGIATGSQALLFWLAVVICGAVIPLVCGYLAKRKPDNAMAYAICALVGGIAGSVAFRALMWLVGVAIMNSFGVVL